MKTKHNIKIYLIVIAGLLSGCIYKTEDCPNRLKNYPFPYDNGDLIVYENEKGTTHSCNIEVTLEDLGEASLNGDEGHADCAGSRIMTISDFKYEIWQSTNMHSNYIEITISFNGYNNFIISDTIQNYDYKDESFEAYVYLKAEDSTDIRTKYTEFIISEDRELLEFSKRNNDITEKWFLQ